MPLVNSCNIKANQIINSTVNISCIVVFKTRYPVFPWFIAQGFSFPLKNTLGDSDNVEMGEEGLQYVPVIC